jgi:hypothetical protein
MHTPAQRGFSMRDLDLAIVAGVRGCLTNRKSKSGKSEISCPDLSICGAFFRLRDGLGKQTPKATKDTV